MPEATPLIRLVDGQARLASDDWQVVDGAEAWDAVRAGTGARAIVPLDLALAHPERLAPGRGTGIWLAPADDPLRAAPLLERVGIVAVDFPKFTDGRGYSTAYLLRRRLGWSGELRATGDVLQDQLAALARVGFDSFALHAGRDPQAALAAFAPFTGAYQGSVDDPRPHYRRVAAA
jgi:uncharacterized protein (DUF934 family)